MATRIRAVLEAVDLATPTIRRIDRALSGLSVVAAGVGAYALGRALVSGMVQATRASAEAEKVTARLAQAIANSGQSVGDTLPKLEAHADALRKITAVDDEAIKSGQALLIGLGRLRGEGLERATEAALNFSAGAGKGLDEAFQALAKAAAGNTTALGKLGIVVDENIPKGEKFAAVLAQLEQRFGGQAAAQANTYEGALKGVGLAWEEVQEKIGAVITQSPTIRTLLTEITRQIDKMTESLGGADAEGKIKTAVFLVGNLAKAVNFAGRTATNAVLAYRALWDVVSNPVTGGGQFVLTLQKMQEIHNQSVEIDRMFDEIINAALAAKGPVNAAAAAAGDVADDLAGAFDAAGVRAWAQAIEGAVSGASRDLDIALGRVGIQGLGEMAERAHAVEAAFQAVGVARAQGLDEGTFDHIIGQLSKMAVELEAMGFTIEGFAESVGKTSVTLDQALSTFVDVGATGLLQSLEDSNAEVEDFGRTMNRVYRSAGVNAALALGDALVTAAESGKFAFKEFARSVLADFARMISQALIMRAVVGITGAIPGGGGGWQSSGGAALSPAFTSPVGGFSAPPPVASSVIVNAPLTIQGSGLSLAEMEQFSRQHVERVAAAVADRVRRGGRYRAAFA